MPPNSAGPSRTVRVLTTRRPPAARTRRERCTRVLVALALVAPTWVAAACGSDGGEYGGIDTPAATGFEGAVSCPDTALRVGAAGTTMWQTIDVTWRASGLDGVLSDYVYLALPDDLLSLSVSVEAGSRWTAINHAVLDDRVLLDLRTDLAEGPYFHEPIEVATLTWPINDATYLRGGCLAIDPIAYDTESGDAGRIHVVARRDGGGPAVVDLNVVVVGDTDVSDQEIDEVLRRVGEVYGASGVVGLGSVTRTSLDWPDPYVDAEGREANRLRASAVGQDPFAVNLFFVQDFNEVGTLGIAAGIPGPNGVPNTAASGVMVSVDTHLDGSGTTLLTRMMGETIAHEVGHQLGLFHTSEAEGDSHDPISDTPECGTSRDADRDGELTAEECHDAGGRNFMFWTASEEFAQDGITPIQAAVLRDNVIARPR